VHFKDGALPAAIEERLVRVRHQPFGSSGLTGEYPDLRSALAGPLASGDAQAGERHARRRSALVHQGA